jgi:hypothetical protein
MPNDNETKNNQKPEAEIAPATVDLGDAADPFERLQAKQVAVAPWSTQQEKSEQIQAVVKKWSKISPKIFLIGCGWFFMIFLLLVFVGLYYAIESADFLQGVGLEIDDVKNILLIFASLFFWILFLGWFYVFVLNIYRLVTTKARKLPFILWLIGWLLIIIITIIAGTLSISKIRSLWTKSKIITDQLVMPFVETKDKSIRVNDWIPVIAPLKMKFQLNKQQIDKSILPSLWSNAQITSFEVECGNEQKLSAGQQIYQAQTNNFFPWYCLYLNKWSYPIILNVNYLDRSSGETITKPFPVWDFIIGAEIQLQPVGDTARLNDKSNEYIIWTSPVTVNFRGQLLFSDLWLKDDRIEWDFDNDGQPDITNNAAFSFPFGVSKLYPIRYRLPGIEKYASTWLTFDLRVLESELAQCTITPESVDKDKKFRWAPKFDELMQVDEYHYTIVDTTLDTIVDTIKESRNSVQYTFPKWWRYEIQTKYVTADGKKWSCRTAPVVVWFAWNQVSFDLKRSQDDSTPFLKIWEQTPVSLDVVENKISVNLLPALLEFTVTDVQPDPNAKVQLKYDGKQIFEDRSKVFEVPITNLWNKKLTFIVTTEQGNVTEQEYEVIVSRQPVKAMIEVTNQVWDDPLEVTLDASVSPLYDEKDEIVYFSWDFGDGETKQNISQWKITHTYRFNQETEQGEFFPSVTVKTKLWFTDTYRVPTAISVKKKQQSVNVIVDSHPTHQVRAWEIVQFRVETDGAVKHIDWDFWNGQVLWCDDRSCSSASNRYEEAWEFAITAEIQYEKDVPVKARTKIKVY